MQDESGNPVVQVMTWLLSGMAVSLIGFVGLGGFDRAQGGQPVQVAAATSASPLRPVARTVRPAQIVPLPETAPENAPETAEASGVDIDRTEELVTRGASDGIDVAVPTEPAPVITAPTLRPPHGSRVDAVLTSAVAPVPALVPALVPAQTADQDSGQTQPRVQTPVLASSGTDHALSTQPCVAELQQLAGRARIYFDEGSSAIPSQGRLMAVGFAQKLRACPSARVTILGFTDPSGNPTANLALSWQRARTVLDMLTAQGVPAIQITAKSHLEGHGDNCEHFDVVDRRVEFEVTEVSAQQG